PQRAIAVLAEAARRAKMSADKYKVISAGAVQKIVSEKAHVPAESLGENEAQKLLGLESELQKFVVGQVQAVRAVSEALRRARSGLASAARPLASFLFLGPTGVGKTELAKTLAAVYFGEEKYLLRLDMSEFRGPDGLAKLLGAESARLDTPLIKHLKNYPFCLLLLDEFEKASPEVWNIFLQILEDGRLTTAKGETLDLTHAMVIATSNAGTRDIQEGLRSGQALDQIQNQLFNNILTGIFPPELLNRFDGIVLFTPLSQPEVKQIALLQLQHLASQLKDKGIKIGFTENVVSDIAAKAFDPLLGARPIRRYIQDHLESFVAKMILSKKLSRGSEITIDIKDGELAIK
ncbi:MAG TPA: AAA family ATPase, partial [Patescibacteria group bacterium]|nr:AAA family ATPase [Patescibacteria group bacterium]